MGGWAGVLCWVEAICALLSETDKSEAPQAIVQTDMFGGEHTPLMKDLCFMHQQVQHVIGPKQTSRLQVTDIRFAKIGKDAQRRELPRLRRAMRQTALAEGCAPTMCLVLRSCLVVVVLNDNLMIFRRPQRPRPDTEKGPA